MLIKSWKPYKIALICDQDRVKNENVNIKSSLDYRKTYLLLSNSNLTTGQCRCMCLDRDLETFRIQVLAIERILMIFSSRTVVVKVQSLVAMFSSVQVICHAIDDLIQWFASTNAFQKGRVDRLHQLLIIRSRKVNHSDTLLLFLIDGWFDDSMNGSSEETACHKFQSFSYVDNEVVWDILDPLPVAIAVQDLQSRDRLGEQ